MARSIYPLKISARLAYREYRAMLSHYDCGIELAKYLNPDIELKRREFNDLMDEIAKLDPNAPKERL